MATTVTSRLMRSINYANTLKLIRQNGPIARTEIAHQLDASLSTIVRIVDDLVTDNLVRDTGLIESTAGRGRPLVEFNGSAHAVVGIDLGEDEILGVVSDLSGNIQHQIVVPCEVPDQPNDVSQLADLIEQLLAVTQASDQTMRGIAIGAPGVTQGREGIVTWAPSLNWKNLPLKQILAERFQQPIFVENDVNLLTLGEWGFGSSKDIDDLVCIFIGTGIGAGLVVGGTLQRGFNQAAGEVGRLLTSVECLGQTYENRYGALEQEASETAIRSWARQALGDDAPKDATTTAAVFDAAAAGQDWAIPIVNHTLDYLSLAIANLSCIVNPEAVVLGGSVTQFLEPYLPAINRRLDGAIPFVPRIEISTLGRHAVTMGAAMLILLSTLESHVIKQFA